MAGFHTNIEDDVKKNDNFRKVLFTGKYQQLVLMTLKPGEEIGMEVHKTVDQFFRIEEGQGKAIIDDEEIPFADGDVVIVPAGSQHNIINTSKKDLLRLYTIYAPPNHPDGTVHKTKKEADDYEANAHH